MDFEIKLEDVPKEQREIARTIGIEAFIKPSKLCGGQQGVYISKYTQLAQGARNRRIKEKYNNGDSIRQLARENKLSSRWIRKIVTAKGEEEDGF